MDEKVTGVEMSRHSFAIMRQPVQPIKNSFLICDICGDALKQQGMFQPVINGVIASQLSSPSSFGWERQEESEKQRERQGEISGWLEQNKAAQSRLL